MPKTKIKRKSEKHITSKKESLIKTKVFSINLIALTLILAIVFSGIDIISVLAAICFVLLSFAPLKLRCEECRSSGYTAGWVSEKCLVCGTKRYGFVEGIPIWVKRSYKAKFSKIK